jgi:hypothetical protein
MNMSLCCLQRPEVRLHITDSKTTHVLEACLTPEGARSYRIDGKIKTGTQVKVCSHCSEPNNVSTVRPTQEGLFAVKQPPMLHYQSSGHAC